MAAAAAALRLPLRLPLPRPRPRPRAARSRLPAAPHRPRSRRRTRAPEPGQLRRRFHSTDATASACREERELEVEGEQESSPRSKNRHPSSVSGRLNASTAARCSCRRCSLVPVPSRRPRCCSLLLLTGPAPMLQFDDPKKVASFNRSAVVSRTAVGKVRAHTHTATRTPAGSLAFSDALTMPRHAYGREKWRACEANASGTVPSGKMREWRTPPLRAITQFLCTARAAFVRCTTGRPK